MAQGEFTKQEADQTAEAVNELFLALSKSKGLAYIGHLNDILLFIQAARNNAPDEGMPQEEIIKHFKQRINAIQPGYFEEI